MEDMDPGGLLQGTMAELATITLWGGRGRDGSKKISLGFATFFFLLFSSMLIWIISHPEERGLGGPAAAFLGKEWLAAQERRVVGAASLFLASGCLSLPLHIGQLYLSNKLGTTNVDDDVAEQNMGAPDQVIMI